MNKVLVTHPAGKLDLYFGPRAQSGLREVAAVVLNPFDRELEVPEMARIAGDCAAVIAYRGTAGTAGLFDALPSLRAFLRCAMDIRTIDVDAASVRGILVTRTGAGFSAAVAEWVVGCMVALSRDLVRYARGYGNGEVPRATMGLELRRSTVGVIGYGLIGREVCRLAQAFGMQVLVADPHVAAVEPGIEQVVLPNLLARSDWVVCLAPATAETESMMNRQAFAAMKPGAYFINAARGDLVDEAALLDALDAGHLAGCAMDVGRAPDQMPTPRLARHPRVIATPHVAGLTRPATDHQALETVRQVTDILRGRIPPGAVNAPFASRLHFGETT